MDNSLKLLLIKYKEEHRAEVLQLLNYKHIPVGAIYLDKCDPENIIITETTLADKYYLYIDGITIFFSYFQLIENC